MGFAPNHKYSEYNRISKIVESSEVSDGIKAMRVILESFKIIITKQREILVISDEANDEGTNALMSDYIREQEKLIWMYSAFLD